MPPNLATEIAALPRLRVSELRAKFVTVFGEPTPSHNKVWLVTRMAGRAQAAAEGAVGERARGRAANLAAAPACRLPPPPPQPPPRPPPPPPPPPRPPPAPPRPRRGTILTRRYKGRTLEV